MKKTGERSCFKMKIFALTLLSALINGSNGTRATDHPNYPSDAIHNGPSGLQNDYFPDPMSSRYDPSLEFPGIQDFPNSPDYSSFFYPNHNLLSDMSSVTALQNDSLASTLFQPHTLGSLHVQNRPFYRTIRNAADKSHDFLNRTTLISHIVNGIAIQSGLMDGKIKINDLVGELLNFGSVPVSSIAKFKPDAITKLTTALKGIQSSLSSNFKDQEEEALKWNELVETSKTIGDLNKLDGKDAYLGSLKKFNSSFDFDSIKRPGTLLQSMANRLGTIENLPESEKIDGYFHFQRLGAENAELITAVPAFNAGLKSLKGFRLEDGLTVIEPIEKMINLIKLRESLNWIDVTQSAAETKSNLQEIAKLSADSTTAIPDFTTITNLAKSRSLPSSNKKTFTVGFPNGLTGIKQLMTDVRDPWIGKITGIDRSLNGLTDGFQPLFKVNDKLSKLDHHLKSISSSKVIQSLSDMDMIQKVLTGIESKVSEQAEKVFNAITKCKEDHGTTSSVAKGNFKETQDIIKNIKKLRRTSQLTDLSVDDFKSEFDAFFKSLGFKDFKNKVESENQIPGVLKKLKDENGMNNIRESITKLKAKFDGLNVATLNAEADYILRNEQHFRPRTFDKEVELHKCLQKLESIADVAQGVSAVQKLRNLNSDDIADVESAVSSVSEVSKSLSDLSKLPDEMKKEAKEATNALNKLPDSLAKSKVIGQSVASLQYANKLKELEPQVAQLKTVGPSVDAEINKISSPKSRKEVEDQWGDHKTEMDSLEKSLASIKSFDSKLDVSKAKSLGDYSNPLKDLSTISDTKINPIEKSKALETLIAQPNLDPKTKEDLEESKKTLDHMAPLDLEFSSHKSQFQSAPAAFKAVHEFLAEFLSVEHSQVNGSEGGISMTVLIGGSGGGILLIACLAGLLFLFIVRRRAQKFIDNNRLIDEPTARAAHVKILNAMEGFTEDEKGVGYDKPTRGKHRYGDFKCNPKTRVHVEAVSDGIHANWVKTRKGKRFIATQAPIDDTQADFWHMVTEHSSEIIVNLCSDDEIKKGKCTQYYPPTMLDEKGKDKKKKLEFTFGPFTITAESVTKILDDTVCERVLKVEHKEKKTTRRVTHYQYLNWPDHSIPDDHVTSLALIDLVKDSKKPIIVHCSAGIGRTMSFIGLQFVYEEVLHNMTVSMFDTMVYMRDSRWGGIQTSVQSVWILLGVFLRLMRKYKLSRKPYDEDVKIMLKHKKNTTANKAEGNNRAYKGMAMELGKQALDEQIAKAQADKAAKEQAALAQGTTTTDASRTSGGTDSASEVSSSTSHVVIEMGESN
ncbi:hypothetical protein B9Z55_016059 [Caenorhabditis nigoni]|uniref:Tyrosine-protein phosphatase domain-containing protein n=1 Tax=Caenorhabditis nigoni TaxID=1611254 RepID=A0A2G5UDU8_9PELO|nr:hypothetical protein B9Z55_016059 [Caenorhabditis nigoni]